VARRGKQAGDGAELDAELAEFEASGAVRIKQGRCPLCSAGDRDRELIERAYDRRWTMRSVIDFAATRGVTLSESTIYRHCRTGGHRAKARG